MRKLTISFLIILIILLVWFLYKQVMYIVKAKWEYGGFKLQNVDLQTAAFIIFFDITNKGLLSVIISEQNYDVYLNDSFISKVNNKNDSYISARGKSRIPFMVNVKLEDLLNAGIKNISSLLNKAEREKIKIRIKGTLTLKLSIFEFKKMNFDMTSTLKEMKEEKPEYN